MQEASKNVLIGLPPTEINSSYSNWLLAGKHWQLLILYKSMNYGYIKHVSTIQELVEYLLYSVVMVLLTFAESRVLEGGEVWWRGRAA